MSTMQLTPEHLSAIVYGLQKHGLKSEMLFESELSQIVKELAKHNLLELKVTDLDDRLYFYDYCRPENAKGITAIQFYKLTQCYQYNSSESPEWESSNAKRWTDSLMSAAIASLPEYNAAKWAI